MLKDVNISKDEICKRRKLICLSQSDRKVFCRLPPARAKGLITLFG